MFDSEEFATLTTEGRFLRALRERVNLSRAKAVEFLTKIATSEDGESVSVSQLERWEQGTPALSIHQLEMLARTYLVPFSSILNGRIPTLAHHDFRRGPDGPVALSYELHESIQEFSRLYALAKDLSGVLGESESVALPSCNLPPSTESVEEIESVATQIRDALAVSEAEQESWTDDDEALAGWIRAVESAGVFVFRLPMDVGAVRGLSRWDNGGPPAILLNRSDSLAAQAFSLTHELGHLATRRSSTEVAICDPSRQGTTTEERIVNRIAGAILLPRPMLDRILPDIPPAPSYRDWPQSLRVQIKRLTHASHGAIGLRLYHLGVVDDPGLAKSFWRQPTGMGWAHDTAAQKLRKNAGERTLQMAGSAIVRELVSSVDIARRLDIDFGVVEAAIAS